jgi:adenylosuccinate synthase
VGYKVVVGANYGDEGKGRITNFLADPDVGSVTRFSGSAQAGHTVVEGDRRHVFKHFGSGTLRGCSTNLTESFICHPIMFRQEREELLAGESLPVFVDDRCQVVLPTDMIINQALEKMRGRDKHGSCGMGVRQAQERGTSPIFRVTVSQLYDHEWLRKVCLHHLAVWGTSHNVGPEDLLATAGVTDINGIIDRYLEDCRYFTQNVTHEDPDFFDSNFGNDEVFEGSQGLALDPAIGQLPYLTPSHVGLGGVASFLRHTSTYTDEIEMVYVTRPYLTRHGAGPLELEGTWKIPFTDETNVPNPWQGALRSAPLNFRSLRSRIQRDLYWRQMLPESMRGCVKLSLAVTCLDQVQDSYFQFYNRREEKQNGMDAFLSECHKLVGEISYDETVGCGNLITCYGESREDVKVEEIHSGIAEAA